MATKVKTATIKMTPRYLTDENGERTGVILSLAEYAELLEAAEQLQDIRHLQKAKKERGAAVPWVRLKAELRGEGKLS